MPKVSVIVPAFNLEKYISKCIESLISQTFKDIEIIIVNDGSTDKTQEICEYYTKIDKRIRILNQKNSGVSVARNSGLDLASGDFITFVDGDDFIENDTIEFLLTNLEKYDVDVSTCGFQESHIDENGKIHSFKKKNNGFGIISSEEALKESFVNGKISLFVNGKLYKKEIFDNIRFPINMIYEDAAVIPLIMVKINKIYYDDNIKYYYIRHPKSITNLKFSKQDLDMIRVNKKNFDMVKEKYDYAMDQVEFRYLWSYLCIIDRIAASNAKFDDFCQLKNFVKKNKFKIFSNKYFTLKRKVLTLIMLINFGLYKKIIIYFHKKRTKLISN